ncbi:uncharacterized protein LOC117809305 isoform X2 [Notolabrus celidotus]|uniref:uncharacterized protein LOC117809305 isoform X2 n=1 Tax=Notolabrus celidotus TaxID=1203425 RepID=UPI00148F6557|nr:uncharacterized protein LOC117809305 isoform X2 [Notolabrus celidotus]
MSRRSLRLGDGLLDRSLPHSSASFSVGGADWKSTRSSKSGRSQQLSVSCSESLLVHTPRKQAVHSFHNSSLHSVASDASLISSLLDESSIQETTLVDTLWESTIVAEQSTILADRTLIGSDGSCTKHPPHTLSTVYCQDCEDQQDRRESTYRPSFKYTSSSSCREPADPDTSIIYSRDRNRKSRTGVLVSVWDRSAACVLSLLAVLCHHLLKHRPVTDVLQLWCERSVLCVRSAAACCASVLTLTLQVCRGLVLQTDPRLRARSSHCRVMNLRESSTHQEEVHPNGSLCDDCKEKQHSVSSPPSSWSSVASCALGLVWSAAVLTGKSAADVCRWLSRRWRHMKTSFPLTRSPLRLLLLLPLLLLLFSLCWFGPAGLWSVLPAVPVTEWSAALPDAPRPSSVSSLLSSQSGPVEGAVEEEREVQVYEEALYSRAPPADTERGEEENAAAGEESVRLERLEQSLTALWGQVETGGRQAEQRHREVLRLYADLQQQQQVSAQSGGEESWLSGLLDQQLDQIRTQLEEERRTREQTREQDLLQQQRDSSRLDELERQLKTLAARTQEVQWRHEASTTTSPSPTLPAAVR